jgi:hypothetical protein
VVGAAIDADLSHLVWVDREARRSTATFPAFAPWPWRDENAFSVVRRAKTLPDVARPVSTRMTPPSSFELVRRAPAIPNEPVIAIRHPAIGAELGQRFGHVGGKAGVDGERLRLFERPDAGAGAAENLPHRRPFDRNAPRVPCRLVDHLAAAQSEAAWNESPGCVARQPQNSAVHLPAGVNEAVGRVGSELDHLARRVVTGARLRDLRRRARAAEPDALGRLAGDDLFAG